MFVGSGAHHLIGAYSDGQEVNPPELSGTQWKHIFIQCRSSDAEMTPGSLFLYYNPHGGIEYRRYLLMVSLVDLGYWVQVYYNI